MTQQAQKIIEQDIESGVPSKESQNIKLKAKSIIDGVFPPEIDTTLVQNSVIAALSGNTQQAMKLMQDGDFDIFQHLPKSMKEDSDIALAAIKKYPHIYHTLSLTLKNKPEIKKQALASGVKTGESIISLIALVEGDKKTAKKMRLFLTETLESKPDYFSDFMSLTLYEIYTHDLEIYTKIISKGLLEPTLRGVTLGNKCINFLTKQVKHLQADSIAQSQTITLEMLSKFLEIPDLQKYPLLYKLSLQLVGGLDIVKISGDEDEDDTKTEGSEKSQDDIVPESSEYYSHGPYSVADTGNYCKLWDNNGKAITLEKSTYDSMSDISLENYMNFSHKMRALGLGFLLEKHLSAIQTATEISFFTGEGMSDARTLMFLNKIGKRLGVPESPYEDSDGNREVLCFHELGSAYFRFLEIAGNGKVGKYHFDVSNRGSNTIVELFMKRIGVINPNSGELSVIAFRDSKLDKS